MKRNRWKKQYIIPALVLELVILAALIVLRPKTGRSELQPSSTMQPQNAAVQAVKELPEESEQEPETDELAGAVLLSELMVKNRAALQHEDGQFYDWFEITNVSLTAVDLTGWKASDGKTDWSLPSAILEPGEYLLYYAAKDADGSFAAFGLSSGDTLSLITPKGSISDSVVCPDSRADLSFERVNGLWQETKYPTPGFENTRAGFVEAEKLHSLSGSLVLNEVCVANHKDFYLKAEDKYPDWVELRNASSASINLSDYYLSDSSDYLQCRLPSITLAPGECKVILCTGDLNMANYPEYTTIPLSLDAENEHLYLSSATELVDYLSLRDIPYGGSYGRSSDSGMLCWFDTPSPAAPNSEGYAYRCAQPVSGSPDGVFENSPVELSLTAEGRIYYTTDGSMPTEASELYTGPLSLNETCVIRAIAVDGKGLPSHARTLNYFINEGYTMPVLSIVGDEHGVIEDMYRRAIKGKEVSGNISFYDGSNGFNVDCGIKMAGRATLTSEHKKNFGFKFRGEYGTKRLDYDLFGDEITSFSNLTLRAGQDYDVALIRNELAQDLCLEMTDKVLSQHSRYCIVYLNGEYYGIYALKEKVNEQFCADYNNVSKESIQIVEGPIPQGTALYNEIIMPCVKDMSVQANYEEYCRHVDIDSVIDWMIIQGFTANSDILYGNIAYYRSTENDGLWRMIYFDLDAAFKVDYYNFRNVFDISYNLNQPAQWLRRLLVNEEFRDRYLTRVSELLKTTLTDENVLKIANGMYALMETELEDNCTRWKITDFDRNRQALLDLFGNEKYTTASVKAIKNYFKVYLHFPEDEVARYFD